DFWFNKTKNLGLAVQTRGAEGFSVPTFDDDDGSLDSCKIGGSDYEGQDYAAGAQMRVKNKKIDIIILIVPRLTDMLSRLANQELVQFEILPNDGLANGRHEMNRTFASLF